MLAIKNPTAWSQLLRLLAEQVANSIDVQQDQSSSDISTQFAIQQNESSDLRSI